MRERAASYLETAVADVEYANGVARVAGTDRALTLADVARRAGGLSVMEQGKAPLTFPNGCYVAAINRVGLERPIGGDGLEFWGQSFVAGTSGQILAKASVDKEEILLVPIELGKVDVTRTHWPFLRDRRIDAYGELAKRFID